MPDSLGRFRIRLSNYGFFVTRYGHSKAFEVKLVLGSMSFMPFQYTLSLL